MTIDRIWVSDMKLPSFLGSSGLPSPFLSDGQNDHDIAAVCVHLAFRPTISLCNIVAACWRTSEDSSFFFARFRKLYDCTFYRSTDAGCFVETITAPPRSYVTTAVIKNDKSATAAVSKFALVETHFATGQHFVGHFRIYSQ